MTGIGMFCRPRLWRRYPNHAWKVIGFTSGGLSGPDFVHVWCRGCGASFSGAIQ